MSEVDDRPRLWIAVPHEGWVRAELVVWLLRHSGDRRFHSRFQMSHAAPVSHNRNLIVKRFLETDAQWLLFLDSDVLPPDDLLDRVYLDKDVLSLPCPVYKGPQSDGPTFSMNFVPEPDFRERLQRGEMLVPAVRAGTGVMLIARRVLEHRHMRGAFLDIFDEDGLRVMGEDYAFCERARAAGFEVWVDMSAACGHVKEVDLLLVGDAQTRPQVPET